MENGPKTILCEIIRPIRGRNPKRTVAFDEKKVPLHHNKALSLTSAIALVKLVEFGYELLLQPPFPTDLTPCNFFLFPNLKNFLSGQIFESNGSRKRIYHAG